MGSGSVRSDLLRQVFGAEMVEPSERDRALQAVLELADVPGPVVSEEKRRDLRGEVNLRLVIALGGPVEDVCGQ